MLWSCFQAFGRMPWKRAPPLDTLQKMRRISARDKVGVMRAQRQRQSGPRANRTAWPRCTRSALIALALWALRRRTHSARRPRVWPSTLGGFRSTRAAVVHQFRLPPVPACKRDQLGCKVSSLCSCLGRSGRTEGGLLVSVQVSAEERCLENLPRAPGVIWIWPWQLQPPRCRLQLQHWLPEQGVVQQLLVLTLTLT